MKHNLLLWLAGVVVAVVVSAPTGVQAETRLSGVAGGLNVSTVMGDNYQNFSQPMGGVGQIWVEDASLLGSVFQFHGSLGYSPYKVRGLTDYTVNQWSFLFGLETGRNVNPNWLRTFVSLNVGAVYSKLGFPAAATNTTPNSSMLFATQVSGGLDVPLFGKLSLQATAPLMVVFSSNKLVTLNGEFSLRWAL